MSPTADRSPETVSRWWANPDSGPRVLITAGPTREPIDAVRYLGNRSSGKMGLALAKAASERGWSTTLLLGPTGSPPPPELTTFCFQTTADLKSLLEQHWPNHDLLLMAAAVADFVPRAIRKNKLPRASGPWELMLEPTHDVVAGLAATRLPSQRIVGFALESAEDLLVRAEDKRQRKQLDAIVANPLETMDSEVIEGTLLGGDGVPRTPGHPVSKLAFAHWLLAEIIPPDPSPDTRDKDA